MTASSAAEWVITGVAASIDGTGGASDDLPVYVLVGIGGAGAETSVAEVPVITTPATSGGGTQNNPAGAVALAPGLRISASTRIAVAVAFQNTASGQSVNVTLIYTPWANLEGN